VAKLFQVIKVYIRKFILSLKCCIVPVVSFCVCVTVCIVLCACENERRLTFSITSCRFRCYSDQEPVKVDNYFHWQ